MNHELLGEADVNQLYIERLDMKNLIDYKVGTAGSQHNAEHPFLETKRHGSTHHGNHDDA